jgi:hypothetical protein
MSPTRRNSRAQAPGEHSSKSLKVDLLTPSFEIGRESDGERSTSTCTLKAGNLIQAMEGGFRQKAF